MMPNHELITADGLTPVGIVKRIQTVGQWRTMGQRIMAIERATPWWVGDWFNAGKWGARREMCEELGINYDTATQYGSVCTAFQTSDRSKVLTFSHHLRAMAAQPEDRARWLQWAVDNGASVSALSEAIREEHAALTVEAERSEPDPPPQVEGPPDQPSTWTCAECGAVFPMDVEACGCQAAQEPDPPSTPAVDAEATRRPPVPARIPTRVIQAADYINRQNHQRAVAVGTLMRKLDSALELLLQFAPAYHNYMTHGTAEEKRQAKTIWRAGALFMRAYMQMGYDLERVQSFFRGENERNGDDDAE